MKELTIIIPDDSAELVTELVEKLGGSIGKKERTNKRTNKLSKGKGKDISLNKKKGDPLALFGKYPDFPFDKSDTIQKKRISPPSKKVKEEKIDHTYLFGKWKDFDMDAEKLREELWKRY